MEPTVLVRLDSPRTTFQPGETLSGEFHLEGTAREQVRAVELSVLWYTDGKGDQDLHVRHFERWAPETGDVITPGRVFRFSTVLPKSPLSYDGLIVRIRWCLRLRVFLRDGGEVHEEIPFRLGRTAPARIKLA